jgi:predicted PurR-regulated permease PerM
MSDDVFIRPVLGVIAAIAVIWFLQTAEAVLAPLVLALVFGVVTAPATDTVVRWGVPRTIAAFLVLLITLGIVLTVLVVLSPVIERGLSVAPLLERELRDLFATLRPAMESLNDLRASLEETLNEGMVRGAADTAAPTGAAGDTGSSEGEGVDVPSPLDALWYAPGFLSRLLIFVGTLYFFLLARQDVYSTIHRDGSRLNAATLHRAEARVSRYFLTITGINAVFGGTVAVAMTLIGMPMPIVWGLAAFLTNFIVYLGPMVFAVVLLLAGVTLFEGVHSVVPAATYVALNAVEGQFVTPALVGKRMAINPLLVFVSLVFWLWLWGALGGIIAIPLLLWGLKIRETLTADEGQPARIITSSS